MLVIASVMNSLIKSKMFKTQTEMEAIPVSSPHMGTVLNPETLAEDLTLFTRLRSVQAQGSCGSYDPVLVT